MTPKLGARRARHLVEGRRAVQRHRPVQRAGPGVPPAHQLRGRRARVPGAPDRGQPRLPRRLGDPHQLHAVEGRRQRAWARSTSTTPSTTSARRRPVLDPATGLPVTVVNRYGRLDNDRKHILNLSGAKSFDMTERQQLTFGGWFTYRTGKPWGLRPNVSASHPARRRLRVAPTITTTRYIQPRDANELEDIYALNLTGAWEFPIAGRVPGACAPRWRTSPTSRSRSRSTWRPGSRSWCGSRSRSRARCGSSRASGSSRRRLAAASERRRYDVRRGRARAGPPASRLEPARRRR